MRTIDLKFWADFPKAITEIRAEFSTCRLPGAEGNPVIGENQILYRGQSDSRWLLQTTLERVTDSPTTVQQYLQCADSYVNEIESITGRKWNLQSYPDIVKEIETCQDFMRVRLPHYDYLVYLRHHGFPSPLLDWTTSSFIAAYFAFEANSTADCVSVFAFIETPQGVKSACEGDVLIHLHGRFVTTHPRHFTQKAFYTTATCWDREERAHTFCSHDSVALDPVVLQDVLIKITIPRSERIAALKQLDEYNINHYSLFHTEDALIRTMAMRAFDLGIT